jgi:hypothetical protein
VHAHHDAIAPKLEVASAAPVPLAVAALGHWRAHWHFQLDSSRKFNFEVGIMMITAMAHVYHHDRGWSPASGRQTWAVLWHTADLLTEDPLVLEDG